ncbi:putative germin-like protein 2-1 [Apium graveolens]|uniref:putative germin-like protein 2-1 n=1 Tax=Apium graveolens TaxID=4045 RepID=UPI003D794DE3
MALGSNILLIGFVSTITCFVALASDNNPVQDFCVSQAKGSAGGAVCKDPKTVNENDFFTTGLQMSGNTSNALGVNVNMIDASRIPGQNTLGISLARIDYAPLGVGAPHTHRGSEIITIAEGTVLAGFVTSGPEYRGISKVLNRGDVFVFPEGLAHYSKNLGNGNAVAFAGFSGQNPEIYFFKNVVFGAKPEISADILAKSFRVNGNVIDELQAPFKQMLRFQIHQQFANVLCYGCLSIAY